MQKTFDYEILEPPVPDDGGECDWDPDKLQWFCRSVLESAFPAFRGAGIHASFYAYVGLTHTLRRKQDGWILRISDHCRFAPARVIEAIVRILAHKVMGRKPPRKSLEIYAGFRSNPAIETIVRNRRVRKGRKQFSDRPGRYHSLRSLYGELNDRYFNGQIEVNRIGWGLRMSWDRLGHYDPVHHTITLSPALDSPDVPSYVVRYIVFHEMLHALFGDRPVRGAHKHHPREFRRTESAYPDYDRAKRFLKDFSRPRRR